MKASEGSHAVKGVHDVVLRPDERILQLPKEAVRFGISEGIALASSLRR